MKLKGHYGSQLKGWAVDRILNAGQHGLVSTDGTVKAITDAAIELAAFCYEPEEEIKTLQERLAVLEEEQKYMDAVMMQPASGQTVEVQ